MQPDYLIIGSGLSALVFGALMAKAGKTVHILEAPTIWTGALLYQRLSGDVILGERGLGDWGKGIGDRVKRNFTYKKLCVGEGSVPNP
jgi:choline dehydrogenase-like flavoprotein